MNGEPDICSSCGGNLSDPSVAGHSFKCPHNPINTGKTIYSGPCLYCGCLPPIHGSDCPMVNTNPAPFPQVRKFGTGATRDLAEDKNDYEGFLSPIVLEEYGNYMQLHRKQSDGSLRDSDNWQKGMPRKQFMKSLLRHVWTAWKLHRGYEVEPEKVGGILVPVTMKMALCGVLFNAMGYLHELLIERDVEDAA